MAFAFSGEWQIQTNVYKVLVRFSWRWLQVHELCNRRCFALNQLLSLEPCCCKVSINGDGKIFLKTSMEARSIYLNETTVLKFEVLSALAFGMWRPFERSKVFANVAGVV